MPRRVPLPPEFLSVPLAHRGLHGAGRVENGRAAFRAAARSGYGIELDVRLSRDGRAVVFHDADLRRLTGSDGAVSDLSASELAEIPLAGSDDTIPTLEAVLREIGGRVPVLIELKDPGEGFGDDGGGLAAAVAEAVASHPGPIAAMSFNPRLVGDLAAAAPELARGLTTCAFAPGDWPGVSAATLARLREISGLDAIGAGFVSHDRRDLARPRIAELRAAGIPVLTWTIRTPEEAAEARRHADNITFEGYRPRASPDREAAPG